MNEKKKTYALYKATSLMSGYSAYVLGTGFADVEAAVAHIPQFGPIDSVEKVCSEPFFAIAPAYLERFFKKGEKPNERE